MQRWLRSAVPVLVLVAAGCRATLPSQLPADAGWLVAVKSCPLPEGAAWWKRWAHHAWVDVRRGDTGQWQRFESGGHLGVVHMDVTDEEARLDRRFGERVVRLLGWIDGEDARAAIALIDARASELAAYYGENYTVWPGPNSNTFVRELLADVPQLGFVFDPNAIGKDYAAWLGAGWTASKTGVRIDTPVLGAAVGLREGVELHLLQLTIGVSIDPPGLSLPFLPQIPWGWFGAPPARLVPPAIPGALVWTADAAALDGERRELGELAPPAPLVIALADSTAWLRIDGSLGAAAAASVAREWDVTIEHHDQDGVWSHGQVVQLAASGPPQPIRLHLGEAVVFVDARLVAGDRIALGVRCYRSIEHEAEANR